jgi:hypothetical protein
MEKNRRVGLISVLTAAAAALTVGTSAVPASADAHGCNGAACIWVYSRGGSGTFITHIQAYRYPAQPKYTGHYHITGPGINANSVESYGPLTYNIYPNRSLPNNSQVCAEAWTYSGGRWVLKGRACETVHA